MAESRAATEGVAINSRPRRKQQEVLLLLLGVDAVAILFAVTFTGAFRLIFAETFFNPIDVQTLAYESALVFPVLLALFRFYDLYDLERAPGGAGEYSTIARAVTAGAVIGIGLSYFADRETLVSRSWLVATWASCVVFVIFGRAAAHQLVRVMRTRGKLRTRLVIVGASDFGVVLARRFSDPAEGYDVGGFIDAEAPLGASFDGGWSVLGRPSDLTRGARDFADEFVVMPTALPYERLQEFIQQLLDRGVRVRLAEVPVPVLRRSRTKVLLKRMIDVIGATVGLLLLFPLLTLIAIAIKLSSPGPVLYLWRVVGEGGRQFVGYKFRTMVENADALKPDLLVNNEMRGPVFKMRQDPRITPIGRFLRRYSLDELPQLWSVLIGDMSLVGPRPPFRHEFAAFRPEQRAKLSVKPGITCLWQISGRNEIHDFDDWIQLDLEYIRTWSLSLDLKILLKTFPAVLARRGAY